MESIGREKVENYFHENNLLVKQQHGLVKKTLYHKSLETLDYFTFSLNPGIPLDVVSLAFDTVPHRRLLAKLEAYGVNELKLFLKTEGKELF